MHRAAVIVSAVFHPLFMPLASVYIAYEFDWYIHGRMIPDQAHLVYFIIALSTIAFPAINILLLKWSGVLSSLERPPKKERIAPFLSTIFFFGMGYYLLRKGQLPVAIYSILLGCVITLCVLALLNTRRKVSAHAAGVFGLLGVVLALFNIHRFGNVNLLVITIVIAAAVLTARMMLKAHSPAEAYSGAVVGFLCMYATVATELYI